MKAAPCMKAATGLHNADSFQIPQNPDNTDPEISYYKQQLLILCVLTDNPFIMYFKIMLQKHYSTTIFLNPVL